MPLTLVSAIRETAHRGQDDLLSAGLGLEGLRAMAPAFADPIAPTPPELRRRAIHANWCGIADLGPLGGYGTLYGSVATVPGREFQAFARVDDATTSHRVLLQAPDAFDRAARCLLVAPASGSRGVYGAIAVAAAWGLPRGFAVAFTDKGAGTGYYDLDSGGGVALDGTVATEGVLEFAPMHNHGASGIAIKHAHSADHPESDWGRHVLQAAHFGLAMLDRAYPADAPFTPSNTRIIAVGLSNGGAAALQAAGLDRGKLLSGVVALAPNVHVADAGRPLYDYATEAALLLPCALADARFAGVPFARVGGAITSAQIARGERLRDAGLISGVVIASQARAALDRLYASGWTEASIATAASSTAFDLWRAIGATYASAYLRASPSTMPCGFRYACVDADGAATPAPAATRATWSADAGGIPPGAGVALLGGADASVDPTATGIEALRALWEIADGQSDRLHSAVAATAAALPRLDLPIIVVHGEDDGLLPPAFASTAYIGSLERAGRAPAYWRVPHAQHFDAFLAQPGFGDRHVPLLPYGYAALDRLWAHLAGNAAPPASQRFQTRPRGGGSLQFSMLGMP